MPPKEKPSKKASREKQTKAIEDLTFGLKNKSKSKKVQQFIERVEKTVKNSNGAADAAKAKDAKKEAKLLKQMQDEELRILFNEGIANQFGKKKSKAKEAAEKMGVAEASKEVERLLEEFSSDSDGDSEEDGGNGGPSGGAYHDDDEPEVSGVEVFREKTIEDIIDEQRAKLAAEGKVGTPVTAESFAIWRAGKLQKRQEEAEARMRFEQMKKKGGKGLSVLSGKELFSYNASLFVDDSDAIDASEEQALSADMRAAEALREAQAAQEAERAQAEQWRLQELRRLEEEECQRQDDERRDAASRANRVTFLLCSVRITTAVFDVEDKEDLEPMDESLLHGPDDDEDEGDGEREECDEDDMDDEEACMEEVEDDAEKKVDNPQ